MTREKAKNLPKILMGVHLHRIGGFAYFSYERGFWLSPLDHVFKGLIQRNAREYSQNTPS